MILFKMYMGLRLGYVGGRKPPNIKNKKCLI